MSRIFKVACIQNCAENDVSQNIEYTTKLVTDAHQLGAELICLPENFSCIEPDDNKTVASAFTEAEHPALVHFKSLAKQLNKWLLLGSLTIKISPSKVHNRSYLLNGDGEVISTYNKIHLFDVQLRDGESYKESATVAGGPQAVIAPTPWGKLGLTICYDLRFPHLYRKMAKAGVDFIAVPAAFTRTTGEAHWHALLRARAIENGCYIFAPNQCGVRKSGRETFGHSLIVDPWGTVLADAGENPGVIVADVDTDRVIESRHMIPSLQHDRNFDISGLDTGSSEPASEDH
jgi:predicted amidohydrolase